MFSLIKTGIAAGALAAALSAQAQNFPTKQVHILTPFPAGSGPDVAARLVSDKLTKQWGQSVVVENRPGANGFLAIDAFKKGAKDGSDLIQLDNVHLTAYPHLFKKLPYDPKADFEPLMPLFRAFFFVAAPSDSKYRNLTDLIADAKANPGKLNYGSWSVGNPAHLGSAMLSTATGTSFQHVIFKETSQLYATLANGELAFAMGTSATTGPLYRAGKLKFLAFAGQRRSVAFPDVPTVGEAGGPAGLEVTGWTLIAGPKGLPPAVGDKIRKDIEAAVGQADIRERYVGFGYEQFTPTREQLAQYIDGEHNRFATVIKALKLSLD